VLRGEGELRRRKALFLVEVGREGQGDLGKPVAAGTLLERQGYRDIGPLEQSLAVGQEAIDQPPEPRRGGVKGGADGVGGHLLQSPKEATLKSDDVLENAGPVACQRSASPAVNGLSRGTSKRLKSATLRVTTVR
jgi:hypothetical protein